MLKKKNKIIISDATLRDGNHAIKHQMNNKQIEIDRNVQAISGGLVLCTYASLLIAFN